MASERGQQASDPAPRRLVCEICGNEFGCARGASCWCFGEPYRIRASVAGDAPKDCLCPACLRARAGAEVRVACDPDMED